MALLRGPPLPLHLTLLPCSSLPSKKQSSLCSPLLFHAPSNTLTSSPLLGSRSLLPFPLSVRSAHAVIQSTSSETERKTRLIAQNVPWTSTLDEVRGLFERYGTVADVELSMHNKARNRGLAFVTMETEEEALNALSNLNSFEFDGRVIKVEFARSVKRKPSPPPQKKDIVKGNILFVGNLTWGVKASDLREFFGASNDQIVSVEIIYQKKPRRPAGYGFVSFISKEAVEAAITAFNGKELKGRNIRLGFSKNHQLTDSELGSNKEVVSQTT